MTLGRGIFPEKIIALAVVFIVSTSVTSSAMAQILPPLPENLIEESVEGISLFHWVMAQEWQIICALNR